MILAPLAALTLAASASAAALPALAKRDNNTVLRASALVTNLNQSIEASIQFYGYTNGSGTFVTVDVFGGLFNNSQSPYLYHIHTNPIGQDYNCNDALGHLDPLNVTESLTCDPAFPQYCQEGDISGKEGTLNGTADGSIPGFNFTSQYARWFPQDFSLLGRSIVIHSNNKTRLACGNIISTLDGTADSNGLATWQNSTFVTNYPTAAPYNPPQVATPFVGTDFPSNETIQNLPFPLPNPAIRISDAVSVQLSTQEQAVFANGTQFNTTMFVESVSSDPAPFNGTT